MNNLEGLISNEEELEGEISNEFSPIPNIEIGVTETLDSESEARVEIDTKSTKLRRIFNFFIPRGKDGGETSGGAVNSVNGQTGDVMLNAEDVGALPNTTKIPSNMSDLNNDSKFIDETYHDNTKVDKEDGKVLSTNDYTDEEKEKLSKLENYDDTQVKSDINTINEKIPTQATNNNQLADKDFVNSSLNSITAFYITKNADGDQFNSKAELYDATEFYSGGKVRIPTRNDYCIVLEDETKENSTTRYIYQNEQWEFQYIVNETPLTSEQVKALNSGITPELVAKLQGIDLTDYVKNTVYANNSNFGVVKTNSNYGIQTDNGMLYINRASAAQIISRHQWAPITPKNLDLALKLGMCDGVGEAWTEDEQKSARARIGINEHITLTQAEYNALVEAGTVDENTYYYIKGE